MGVTEFYKQYHGHSVRDLERVEASLRAYYPTRGSDSSPSRALVFLAGDSSLDNKYWVPTTAAAVNGYERILSPATSVTDVTHWMNALLVQQQQSSPLAVINCAVEASTLRQRSGGNLLPQDEFIRDHLQPEDTLVVSVGCNDVALCPTASTITSLALLMSSTSVETVEQFGLPTTTGAQGEKRFLFGTMEEPPGFAHFQDLFQRQVEEYLRHLTSKQSPRRILVCTIYYPDECNSVVGWATVQLALLGYCFPGGRLKLQAIIRKLYECITKQVRVPGVEVVAVPLFAALNGKDTLDYVSRVEPSGQGGRKVAELLFKAALGSGQAEMDEAFQRAASAPHSP